MRTGARGATLLLLIIRTLLGITTLAEPVWDVSDSGSRFSSDEGVQQGCTIWHDARRGGRALVYACSEYGSSPTVNGNANGEYTDRTSGFLSIG